MQSDNIKPRRGDVDPSTGLVYWDTWRGVQRWRTPSVIARWRRQQLAAVVRWQKADIKRHRDAQRKLRERHGKERNARSRGYRNRWKKNRIKSDPLFALHVVCATRVRNVIRGVGFIKSRVTQELIGCSFNKLRAHIESLFKPGMTWKNRGYYGWHIDHIIPVSAARNKKELLKLFHYTNLQPLWAADNIRKSNKIDA